MDELNEKMKSLKPAERKLVLRAQAAGIDPLTILALLEMVLGPLLKALLERLINRHVAARQAAQS